MQITLNQEEIELALDNFVRSRIQVSDGQDIVFDLKAGRGDNGFTATLDIVPSATTKSKPVALRSKPRAVETPKVEEPEAPEAEPMTAEEPETEVVDESTEETVEEAPAPKSGGSLFSKTAKAS